MFLTMTAVWGVWQAAKDDVAGCRLHRFWRELLEVRAQAEEAVTD